MNNQEKNTTENLNDELIARREKLNTMIANGDVPYKDKFERTHTLLQSRSLETDTKVKLCGRLISKRIMGKLIFAHIYDIDATVQISISKGDAEEAFNTFKTLVDTGDYIAVEGEMYTTPVGEVTCRTHKLTILSKALRPLPEKFHGISDIDLKYRQRYLDLISNEETREVFKTRMKLIRGIREFLFANDFVEVETPTLQNVACGAMAKPFITKHNALDKELYLRIAPEIYLKQVIQGGFDRVFELGKNFRNEGMDPSHLQEFTMIEWYASYWDFNDNIDFLTKMLQKLIMDVTGSLTITYQGQEIDFSKFQKLDYTAEINKVLGINVLDVQDVQEIKDILLKDNELNKTEIQGLPSVAAAIDYAFKKKIRPSIVIPTFTYNYPAVLIPLARRNDADPRIIDMFQLIVNGWEVVKAYSELINPITQREAFEEQMENRKKGDDEAMELDEAFLLAMEHGMPPMSGLGIGIDRIVSLLTDQPTLRDVILFPTVK